MIILLYHHISRISPGTIIRGLYTTPNRFRWQINWLLSHGYTFTTFEKSDPGKVVDQSSKEVILTFDDGSVSVFKNGFPILDKLGIPAVVFPITSLIARQNAIIPSNSDRTPRSFLDVKQIRELADAGWEIGSHLQTHKPVTSLSDTELSMELAQSKVILEEICRKPVITVAYPYGIYDERTLKLAADNGYRFGLTTDHPSIGFNPLFQLQRIAVKGARWYHRYYFLQLLGKQEH